ncbi:MULTISPECIES: hypothetical protein [Clostridia]|uniref:hypothetical protein n=1 Tax=Clostridia TaxID=186801 RepID=UPI000EA04E87|nr:MULTISPECIES: hypothetical protein [Clostridia]NBJ68743.1 hypothetical protein [Roseburia sp. 1XD42-34]RKI80585.1 hypothetical protein D7V87_03370 [Clostridium sp. 1xD42-85]
MNNIKTFVLLLGVLGINTLRYGSYLLEGYTNVYYLVFFFLNLLALIVVILSRLKISAKKTDEKKVNRK